MLGFRKKYCYACGLEVKEGKHKRFGKYFCSEAHAEEYMDELRRARQAQIAEEEQHTHGGYCQE